MESINISFLLSCSSLSKRVCKFTKSLFLMDSNLSCSSSRSFSVYVLPNLIFSSYTILSPKTPLSHVLSSKCFLIAFLIRGIVSAIVCMWPSKTLFRSSCTVCAAFACSSSFFTVSSALSRRLHSAITSS